MALALLLPLAGNKTYIKTATYNKLSNLTKLSLKKE
jgi:hypothetical protein